MSTGTPLAIRLTSTCFVATLAGLMAVAPVGAQEPSARTALGAQIVLSAAADRPDSSNSLTAQQCAEISARYQIIPPQCEPSTASPDLETVPRPNGLPAGYVAENHIFFPGGGSGLDPAANQQIAKLVQLLQGRVLANACLQLIGHSDTSGQATVNQQIALRRAQAVQRELQARLGSDTRISSVASKGETAPLVGRAGTDKWQRRVEIRARKCGLGNDFALAR